MNRHVHSGISIDVPASWSEQTNVIYGVFAPDGTVSPVVSLSFSPRAVAETLGASLDSMLAAVRASRVEFNLLERKESTFGGLPADSARYTSRIAGRIVEESITVVVLTQQGHSRTAMFSTMVPVDADAEVRALCERVLQSVRFNPP